ncbi:regulatory protein RecX [Curtobacterium ammoniigenes]|uniref:regulatory protein RecX n=1 Tax=Curtobacterium ammoniigenes TaxID=395387 RepID=UPI00146FE3BC|nr:regulatory protein RecX [Curtobacterium ammoniigenes]
MTELFSARRGSAPRWLPPVTGLASSTASDSSPDAEPNAPVTPVKPVSGLSDVPRASAQASAAIDGNAPALDAAAVERLSIRALSRRQLSSSELRAALQRHDTPADAIDAEIARLERVGLLDDHALAGELIDRLRTRKQLGRIALVQALRQRGLPAAVIDEALDADTATDDDEASRVNELAERRAAQLRNLDRATAERRLAGFLQRKGYSGSLVRDAVTRALGGAAPGSTSTVRFE